MNYSGIINCSIVDGLGFRTTLFISGCKHCCEGCQNKHTWDFKAGKPYTQEVEVIENGQKTTKEVQFFGWEKIDAVDQIKRAFEIC
jgi:pyruvate-formate lyase-activating enzyme